MRGPEPLCRLPDSVTLAIEAAKESGVIGAFTGGITATAGGVAAAIVFGYLNALLFTPKTKM